MSNKTVTAVLVDGAGTGAWVWNEVQSRLGLASVAVDLPLHESLATPEYCVEIIRQKITTLEPTNLVVVLHSWAGVLARLLANALGDRLVQTVYLSAVIPADGSSFVDSLPIPQRWIVRALYSKNPAGLRPSESMIRKEYCNDLSETDAMTVIERFTIQRPEPYLSPVPGPKPDVPSTYIHLSRDRSLPTALQKRYSRRLTNAAAVSIDAGHLAMLSRPAEIADAILGAARG